jgi:hypothetical protein
MFPISFRDQDEYDAYKKCKKTIRIGDKVQVFLFEEKWFSRRYGEIDIHNITEPIDVIAMCERNKVPVIGATTPVYPSLYVANYAAKGYEKHLYTYKLLDSDIRIARIIRGKRQ